MSDTKRTWSIEKITSLLSGLLSKTKGVQSAVSDPSASGTSLTFIDSVSQDAQGVITPTKKTVDVFHFPANINSVGTAGLVPGPDYDDLYRYLKGTGWSDCYELARTNYICRYTTTGKFSTKTLKGSLVCYNGQFGVLAEDLPANTSLVFDGENANVDDYTVSDILYKKVNDSVIAIVEDDPINEALHDIQAGKYVIWHGNLCVASQDIERNDPLSSSNLTLVENGLANLIDMRTTQVFTDLPFSISTSDWTSSNGVYTKTISNSLITAASGIQTIYDSTVRTALTGDVYTTKATGSVTFTTTSAPVGTFTGFIRVFDSVSGVIPVGRGGTGGTTTKTSRAALNVPIRDIPVDFGTVSSLPQTVSDADLTANMVAFDCVFGNPAAIPGGIDVTFAAGSVTIDGTLASGASTSIKFWAHEVRSSVEGTETAQEVAHVSEYVQVNTQTLTDVQKATARTNIGVNNFVNWDYPNVSATLTNVDLNTVKTSGVYKLSGCTNDPLGSTYGGVGIMTVYATDTDSVRQTWYRHGGTADIYTRVYYHESWTGWERLAYASEVTSLSNNLEWQHLSITRNTTWTTSSVNNSKYNPKLELVNLNIKFTTNGAVNSTGIALVTIPSNYLINNPVGLLLYYPSSATSYKGYLSTDGGVKNSEALPSGTYYVNVTYCYAD